MTRVRSLVLSLATTSAALAGVVLSTAAQAAPSSGVPAAATVRTQQVVAPVPVAVRPVPKPVASPRATSRPAHKPRPTPRVVRPSATPAPVAPKTQQRALTRTQLLQRAVAQLPGFHPGDATFVLQRGLGSWGLTELHGTTVLISTSVPAKRLYDVVAHEWSHVLSVQAYDGDVNAALAGMNAYFGGSGLTGAERAADCMARELGATWTNYTSCSNPRWRAGARTLLAHRPV